MTDADSTVPGTDATGDRGPQAQPTGPRYYRMRRRRRRWLGLVVWLAAAVAAVAVSVTAGAVLFIDDAIDATKRDTPQFRRALAATDPVLPGKPTNILLIGSDARPDEGDKGRSDSLILVKMDPHRDFISMLSFARDLRVEIPGVGTDKINASFFYGVDKTIDTVEKLTGEQVNEFVNIDFEGFVKTVDAVNGVYIDVDRRYFNDNTDGGENYEIIDLEPGYQKLNGADALDYARYRHTDSDFARIARQQQFLSELKRQTKRVGSLVKLPPFAEVLRKHVTMSIDSRGQLIQILDTAINTDKARIGRYRIEGSGTLIDGISYNIASPTEIADAVEQWKNPEFLETAPKRKIVPSEVTIDVTNGSGIVLAADKAAELLAGKGFDARPGGNADRSDYDASVVIYAPDKQDEARAIQKLFGSFTGIEPSDGRLRAGADLGLVVGANFDGKLVPPPPPPAPVTPEFVWTESLVPLMRKIQRAVGGELKTVAPLKVPPGSELRRYRVYRINTGGEGPRAAKLVFRVPSQGGSAYWAMTMTEWTANIPILEGETGTIRRNGREYLTFYDGKSLTRVAWKQNGMSYWVSNTLNNDLNPETMHAIARSARSWRGAKVPKGETKVEIPIDDDLPTP